MSSGHSIEDTAEDATLVDALAEVLTAVPQAGGTPAGRNRLLAELRRRPHRLVRFANDVAQLADISRDAAETLLEALDDDGLWESGLLPGVEAFWVRGGPATRNAIRGFVRVASGQTFPEHEHLGAETVLVMQGIVEDSRGAAWYPGDIVTADAGTRHGFRAREGGVDVLIFSVVRTGIKVGDVVIPARD